MARKLGSLRLVRDAGPEAPGGYSARPRIGNPADVARYLQPFASVETTEVFWVLPLDSQHRVLAGGPIVISRGILNSSLVHPREVFRAAIVAAAAAVILAHNHPSGDPTPSADDKAVTGQLVAAGRLLDIPVLDHVVVTGDAAVYVSLAEAGLLA